LRGARREGEPVYLDDSGQHHDIHVTVEGQDYHAEANYDSHHDGITDSVVVETDHGYIEYTDSHHTGDADVMRELDDHGNVVSEAHFDKATGHWVAADPHASDSGNSHSATSAMVVDTADGDRAVGPATVDTSGSGVPDTAVVHNDDGSVAMYTDTDGDGKADVEVVISKDGEVTILEHSGQHQWTQVEHGHIDSTGTYVPDAGVTDPTHDSLWAIDAMGTHSGGAASAVRIEEIAGYWVAAGANPNPMTDAAWG
jgi:hypothetical protein